MVRCLSTFLEQSLLRPLHKHKAPTSTPTSQTTHGMKSTHSMHLLHKLLRVRIASLRYRVADCGGSMNMATPQRKLVLIDYVKPPVGEQVVGSATAPQSEIRV